VEDDNGRAMHGDTARLEALSGGTQRVVDLAASRRQRAGQSLGRGRMDNGGAQGIGARQQPPGRRWSPTGRQALGICTGVALNSQWAQLWCPQQAAA